MSIRVQLIIKKFDLIFEDKALQEDPLSLLYYGSLRGGEVMGDKEDSYNPTTTLLNSDVGIERVATGPGKSTWMVSVRVRNPKELKGQQEVAVECFATGGENCPVRAVQKVLDMEQGGDRPFASKKDGTTMTKKWLNKTLKGLLQNIVDYDATTVSSHSFRAGLATAMARAGTRTRRYSGKGDGEAFLKYIKFGRGTRLEQQQAQAASMARIAELQVVEMGVRV